MRIAYRRCTIPTCWYVHSDEEQVMFRLHIGALYTDDMPLFTRTSTQD
jgi:hypothetical protein